MYFERLVSAIGYIEKLLPNIENMGFFVDDKETISWNEAKESWLRNSLQRQHFVPTFIHGDFFFGNIFFDQRLNMIKMIDPRGFFGEMQNYGDPLYDLAKLSHSVNGGYDLLSADIFRIFENSNQLNLQTARINSYSPVSDLMQSVLLKHCRKQDKSWKDLRTLESMMFLTLIPLHHDSIDRQKAFVLTALMSLTEAKNGGRND